MKLHSFSCHTKYAFAQPVVNRNERHLESNNLVIRTFHNNKEMITDGSALSVIISFEKWQLKRTLGTKVVLVTFSHISSVSESQMKHLIARPSKRKFFFNYNQCNISFEQHSPDWIIIRVVNIIETYMVEHMLSILIVNTSSLSRLSCQLFKFYF